MMFPGKVAAVSYLNTVPFIYGIEHADFLRAGLLLSPPSRCAELFKSHEADIALVPIGSLPYLDDYRIITNYCIGASSPVRTVTLMTDSPLSEIKRIYLDSHSLTSALLVKIIAKESWGIDPEYVDMSDYSVICERRPGDAFLLIGDKVFDYENRFATVKDLSVAWNRMTKLPLVFAVWIARKTVPPGVIRELDRSLSYGISHVREAIDYYGHSGKPYAYEYLTKNIDFIFDLQKQKALSLYWEKGRKFAPRVNPG